MKKFLGILVLGLLWCNVGVADNLPIKLFGITIHDNANKYIEDLDKGITYESRPGLITFGHNEYSEIKNLEKNTNFGEYYLRTDEKYKILLVGGIKRLESREISTFQNDCELEKKNLIKSLAVYYQVNPLRFVNKYYKSVSPKTKTIYLYRKSHIYYKKNFKKLLFSINCRYGKKGETVSQWLYVTLMDRNYWENNSAKFWEKIQPFDDNLLLSNLQGF